MTTTVSLPVVCSECKADMGTKPGFPASLAGAVSHGVCWALPGDEHKAPGHDAHTAAIVEDARRDR